MIHPHRRRPLGPTHRGLLSRGHLSPREVLLALALFGLAETTFPRRVAADADAAACNADFEAGLKLLGAAEKGDVGAAKRAWETFESSERRCPEDPRFPFCGGLAHVYGDDPIGAEGSLSRLRAVLAIPLRELNRPVAEAEGNPHVLFLRAAYDFRLRGQHKAAAQQLTRVRMRDPRFHPEWVSRLLFQSLLAWGADLQREGDFPQAIAKTLQAKEEARYDLDSKRRDFALRNLAQYYRFADQWTDAQNVSIDLVTRYPKDAVLRYLLASVYSDQLQFDKAVEQWKACLDLIAQGAVPPEDAAYLDDAPMRYGISLASANQVEAGIAKLREFAAKAPQDARPHFYLGRILWDQGHAREARDELETAFSLDPLCAETLALLVTVYDTGAPDLGDDAGKTAKRLAELRALTTEEAKKARRDALVKRKARENDRSFGCR